MVEWRLSPKWLRQRVYFHTFKLSYFIFSIFVCFVFAFVVVILFLLLTTSLLKSILLHSTIYLFIVCCHQPQKGKLSPGIYWINQTKNNASNFDR